MSKERDRRLSKLVELRSKDVDEKLGALARALRAENVAAEGLSAAREEVAKASAQQAEALATGFSPDEWVTHAAWVQSRRTLEQLAWDRCHEAAAQVASARRDVADARSRLQRLEALVERLRLVTQQREQRAERKAEDEFAARRFFATEKR